MLGRVGLALAKLDFDGGSASACWPAGEPYHRLLWLRRGEPPIKPARTPPLITRSPPVLLLMRLMLVLVPPLFWELEVIRSMLRFLLGPVIVCGLSPETVHLICHLIS